MEKMVEKQKKIEQFIYQFTSVRCFLISILITAIRHSVSSLMNILIIFFHIHSGSVRSRVQQQRDKYRANSERTKCRFCQVPWNLKRKNWRAQGCCRQQKYFQLDKTVEECIQTLVPVQPSRKCKHHLQRWSSLTGRSGLTKPYLSFPKIIVSSPTLLSSSQRSVEIPMDRFDSIGNSVSKLSMFFHFLLIIPLVSDCLVWRNGKQPRGCRQNLSRK